MSAAPDKLIIDVRLNEYTFREGNPHIPYSPEEIAKDAAACREAGASIVHYHAREPESGAPSSDPVLYARSARLIREACDAIIMPTLGANTVTDLDERIGHIEFMAKDDATRADLAPLDLASISLAIWRDGMAEVGGDELVYYNSIGSLKALAGRALAVNAVPMMRILLFTSRSASFVTMARKQSTIDTTCFKPHSDSLLRPSCS